MNQAPTSVHRRNNIKQHPGQQHPLVFAHGFGCSQQMWADVAPTFAKQHPVVLFDYVGSGGSDVAAFDPARYSTLDGYAQDLLDVCDATHPEGGLTLIAHSVSCSIAMLAAIQRPDFFKGIVMVGPSPCFLNDPPGYAGGFERADLEGLLELMDQNYLGWSQTLSGVVAGADGGPAVANRLAESFCSTDPRIAKVFAQATFFADNRQDLANVHVPCLLLQHRSDSLAPLSVGEYLHAHLPQSRLEVLDVAGHCAHMSHPSLVIDAIRRFVTEIHA